MLAAFRAGGTGLVLTWWAFALTAVAMMPLVVLLSHAWTVLTGFALTETAAAPAALGLVGVALGVLLVLCSLEFVGRHERDGWALAARLTPLVYVAWSLWLAATGVALLV